MIEELSEDDASAAASLWEEVGLTRPWNDPITDFHRARSGETSAVLGCRKDGELIGTVMVGHDGHRGWVYYLAVRSLEQRSGLGAALMKAGEEWLSERGAVKVQLMVRHSNDGVISFYQELGYEESDVVVLAKWLLN
jgi:ribosomal protein S18 acetylase RimI-like enzyme